MTDLKGARAELEAKRREKAKLDAECAALEQKIETEKARKEIGKKLDPVMEMLLANDALRDELAKYSVRESKIILRTLFGTPAIAEGFRGAARHAEPQLAKLREKAERDKQRRAGRKTVPEDGGAVAAEPAAREQAAPRQEAPQVVRQATSQAAPQSAPQVARPAAPAAHPKIIPAPGLRTVPAPRPQG